MGHSMIKIKRVESRADLRQFIQFYYDLYRGNDYAVPFLFQDEMKTLRSDRNASFECCEACYFMAFKGEQMVGRVPMKSGNNGWCVSAGSTSSTTRKCHAN